MSTEVAATGDAALLIERLTQFRDAFTSSEKPHWSQTANLLTDAIAALREHARGCAEREALKAKGFVPTGIPDYRWEELVADLDDQIEENGIDKRYQKDGSIQAKINALYLERVDLKAERDAVKAQLAESEREVERHKKIAVTADECREAAEQERDAARADAQALAEALEGIFRIADRKTVEFDEAHIALSAHQRSVEPSRAEGEEKS